MLPPKSIAVIGFGEAGTVVAEGCVTGARRLHRDMPCHAWDIGMADPEAKTTLQEAAAPLGVILHDEPGGWLGAVDAVFSLVPGSSAKATATFLLPYLSPGSAYLDLTTSYPADMADAGKTFAARGIGFVDGTALGSFRTNGVTVPFVLSGKDAVSWSAWMNSLGFATSPVEGSPGKASSVGLLRGALVRGLEALAVECFVAADFLGLRQVMMGAFNDFDLRPLVTALENMGESHIDNCRARLDEVDNALRMLEETGAKGIMTTASRSFFARTVESGAKARMDSEAKGWDRDMRELRDILKRP